MRLHPTLSTTAPLALLLAACHPHSPPDPLDYDAGLCGAVYCPMSHSHCEADAHTCVECLVDSDCASPNGVCAPETHRCVPCRGYSSCRESNLPICDVPTGACRGCQRDAECAGLAATPVCDEASGRCVDCTADTAKARCGIHTCDLPTSSCTRIEALSAGRCEPCASDAECIDGHVCVNRPGTGSNGSPVCVPLVASDGCGSTVTNPTLVPYAFSTNVVTVDGRNATVCLPRSSLSCDAILRFGSECVPSTNALHVDPVCGTADPPDGICATSNYVGHCTHVCVDGNDCKYGSTCLADRTTKVLYCR